MKNLLLILFASLLLLTMACGSDEGADTNIDLRDITYNRVDVIPFQPTGFPQPDFPADNPQTKDGIQLGRMLFYDPILSQDSSQSCSSCHLQANAFTDPRQFSVGIDGSLGTRNSMPLFNLVYNVNGFFWDGRSHSIEHQVLEPVENPIELNDTWGNVEKKLRRSEMYQEQFRKAFGIEYSNEIDKALATKAIAQFLRSIISWQSKWDQNLDYAPYTGLRPVLTASEERGRILFFKEDSSGPVENGGDTECGHCHNTRLFTNNTFKNNGLDFASSFDDFQDKGLGLTTNISADNGRFRAPSLRNIELTAPYMHDGRFQTLEEVIDFYSDHLKSAPNLDSNLGNHLPGLQMTQQQKDDIIAYLKTLTDYELINDPQFSSPF